MSRTSQTLELLRQYESRNVTYADPDGTWPIVWDRASGTHVWDVEGRRYLDLTAAFGVASAGHANARVVTAGQKQLAQLTHAMGDVHPHPGKARLAETLSGLTFGRWSRGAQTGKTIFCNSGFEAVEAALKTAHLATGKKGIVAFAGGYHGLGYGALNATHRAEFRQPWTTQLANFGTWVDYPLDARSVKLSRGELTRALRHGGVGAVLVEPFQARGGIRFPHADFLPMLREMCDRHRVLLVLDEIYTGFGRTGRWFACEHAGIAPDLVCLGKALTGGFPLSACVGRADLMDEAWPPSQGEALHTSTFLGHPVGCAMALAQISEIRRRRLPERSATLGAGFLRQLKHELRSVKHLHWEARGCGLMVGVELRTAAGAPATAAALQAVKRLLHAGFIVLPEGGHANVIGFTPPLTISRGELERTARAVRAALTES
jgi:4-aminobutyrate aminotransferase-like enzyme